MNRGGRGGRGRGFRPYWEPINKWYADTQENEWISMQ